MSNAVPIALPNFAPNPARMPVVLLRRLAAQLKEKTGGRVYANINTFRYQEMSKFGSLPVPSFVQSKNEEEFESGLTHRFDIFLANREKKEWVTQHYAYPLLWVTQGLTSYPAKIEWQPVLKPKKGQPLLVEIRCASESELQQALTRRCADPDTVRLIQLLMAQGEEE